MAQVANLSRRMSKTFAHKILSSVTYTRRPSVDSQASAELEKQDDSASVAGDASPVDSSADCEEAQAEREAIIGSLRLLEEAKAMYSGLVQAEGG